MSILNLKSSEECSWDAVSLGEIMIAFFWILLEYFSVALGQLFGLLCKVCTL